MDAEAQPRRTPWGASVETFVAGPRRAALRVLSTSSAVVVAPAPAVAVELPLGLVRLLGLALLLGLLLITGCGPP